MSKKEIDMGVFEEIGTLSGAKMKEIVYGLACGDLYFCWRTDCSSETLKEKFGYEHIESEGGEHCYGVFKLNDKFYQAACSYYAYYDCQYDYIVDTLCEVKTVYVTA